MTELAFKITFTALFAVLGACIASFANVVALRSAKDESYINGRSRCPECGGTLRWFELIPVVSWLIQGGRCRKCSVPISPRYLIVEIAGALALGLSFFKYGFSWSFLIALGVYVILMLIAVIDFTIMEIPNGLVLALLPFAIGAIFAQPEISLISRAIGILTISLPMLILALIVKGAFGGGDIKLMAVVGLLLGWQLTLLAAFIGVFIAGCIAITLIIRKKVKKGAQMAFGPYLCLGTMTAFIFGTEILTWYLGLYGLWL
ncbi:MAG: prepilin peptidase [Oscillospiraceae bacterium]|nr:prepilin peptidase [Oscillospiraceae bacterium]